MTLTFEQYNLQLVQRIVESRFSDAAAVNLAFYRGDHWQQADGYTGPRPAATDLGYQSTMQEIERAFVSRNAIGEITDRHAAGVLGRELHWKFSVDRPLGTVEKTDELSGATQTQDEEPTSEESALIDEAEQALTVWWDRHKTPTKLQDMVRLALLAKRSVLRLFILPGAMDEYGVVPTGDLGESLSRIWLQHLGTNEDTLNLQLPSATVYCDKLTRKDIGIFTYKEVIEDLAGTREGEDRAELCYVEDDIKDPETDQMKKGNTVLRIIGNEGDIEAPVLLPLGGRLTIHEMTRRALVGDQIISQQKLLNLAETMKQRNVVLGGFLERVFLNTQLPGRIVTDSNGVQSFLPNPIYVGAGTTNSLQGIIYKDAQGNEQITNPSVVYRDPVPVTVFSETAEGAYLAILQEANQLHYALAGDAVVSAVSRVQARGAFQTDLLLTAGEVEAAGRWVLETALAMAAHFSGQAGRFDGLRAVVQARVDSGPVTADEKRVAIEMQQAGLWATETSMSVSGIEDTDAEKERIARERQEQQANDAQKMAAVQTVLNKITPPEQKQNGQNPNGDKLPGMSA